MSADPRLKAHRTTGRLDPPDQPSPDQRVQNVIDGLRRDGPEALAIRTAICHDREMATLADSSEHRQTRRRKTQAGSTQVP